jgi:peptidoglycan/LPS O-acetylase OafA/YrhL
MKAPYIRSIDGIRAFAVTVVILYHLFPAVAQNGFLGVDIFFVVSGFVITRSFWYWGPTGRVSFILEFYARRLKRLFPALAVCILISSVLITLSAVVDRAFFYTAAAAMAGAANLLLYYLQRDYFAIDSQLNPFQHTWSLGVEEQFYLVFPLLALVLGIVGGQGKGRSAATLRWLFGLGLASAFAFVAAARWDAMAAFYLPVFRLWELLAGAIAFLMSDRVPRLPSAVLHGCMAAILLVVLWPVLDSAFAVVLLVILTAAVLSQSEISTEAAANRMLASKGPSFIGRISYSLYLYHWPLYTLARLTLGHSGVVLLLVLVATFLLSVLSYRFVETPFRRGWSRLPDFGVIAAAAVVTVGLSLSVAYVVPALATERGRLVSSVFWSFEVPEVPAWPRVDCHGKRSVASYEKPLDHCLGDSSNGLSGDVFLVGDSHAAQLIPALPVLQREAGRDLHFLNTGSDEDFPRAFWATPAIPSDWILEHILRVADPGDLLVVTFHRGRLHESRVRHIPLTEEAELNEKSHNFIASMRPWLKRLEAQGVQVVFAGDTPQLAFLTAVETCWFQSQLFGANECAVTVRQDLHTRYRQNRVFETLAAEFPNVHFYDPTAYFFGDSGVFDPIAPDGRYRMIDDNHLTMEFAQSLSGDLRGFLVSQGLR